MSGVQPLVAPLAISGGVAGAQQQNPLQLVNEVATLQGKLLDNKSKMNSQRAQETLAEIFAVGDPDTLPQRLMNSPAIAYHPEIMTQAAQTAKALVDMAHTRQTMSQNASEQYRKDMIAMYSDPYFTPERAQAIKMAGAANITDPISRQNYLNNADSYMASIVAGAPSAAELMSNPELAQKWQATVRQRLLAQGAAVIGWEANRDVILGGPPPKPEEGIFYRQPFDRGGRVIQVDPERPGQPGGTSTPAPAPAAPGLGAGEGSSTPPGVQNATDAGGGGDDSGPPNALAAGGYGPSSGPASLQIPMPPDATPGAPGYAPGDVQTARLGTLPGTGGPDGPLPPGPPAEAQVAQAQPAPSGQTSAPSASSDELKRMNPYTNQPMYGAGASTHSTSNGIEIAISDGKLMFDPNTGIGKPPAPPQRRASGMPMYEQPTQARIDELAKGFTDDSLKKYPNAKMVLSQTAQIRDSLNQLRDLGGRFLQPGAGEPERMQIWRMVQDMATVLGYKMNPDEIKAEAAYTNLSKLMTTLGFTNVNQFFGAAREAATVIQSSMAAVPGINNTFLGGQLVNRMIEVMAQRTLDEQVFKERWFNANRGDLRGADMAFSKQHDIGELTQSVLSEFGMGKYGFNKQDGTVDRERVRTAYLNGYIDRDQVDDLFAGRSMRPTPGMK